jgi:hypothetical protein
MPDEPDQQNSPLHSTMREFHARCVNLTHYAVGLVAMMATKPPDGNERLDAHLHGEFVKELLKRDSPAGRSHTKSASVIERPDRNHELN